MNTIFRREASSQSGGENDDDQFFHARSLARDLHPRCWTWLGLSSDGQRGIRSYVVRAGHQPPPSAVRSCRDRRSDLVARCDPPDSIADVVGHEQGAIRVKRDAHRSTHRVSVRQQESAQEILGRAGRLPIAKRNEHHLVTRARLAVPRSVLANKRTSAIVSRKECPVVENQAQLLRREQFEVQEMSLSRDRRGGISEHDRA